MKVKGKYHRKLKQITIDLSGAPKTILDAERIVLVPPKGIETLIIQGKPLVFSDSLGLVYVSPKQK